MKNVLGADPTPMNLSQIRFPAGIVAWSKVVFFVQVVLQVIAAGELIIIVADAPVAEISGEKNNPGVTEGLFCTALCIYITVSIIIPVE